MVGNSSTILPTGNVQLINVNTLRQGAPQQGGQRGPAPRLIIPQQLVGGRPQQNLTLQTLQGLQGVQGGHLLLKTESGQYQLLKVGPPPGSNATGTTTIQANNAAGFRLQTIPQQGTVAAANINNSVSSSLTAPTQITPQQTVVQQAPQQPQPSQQPIQVPQQQAPQQQVQVQPPQQQQQASKGSDTVKEKCRKFLSNLLELSSREPKAVERNVRTLIQELVDAKVEPEQFCDRLEKLLNAQPQPCLIGFLKKSLPLLRQSMVAKELVIENIRPPPPTVLLTPHQQQSLGPPLIQQQQQVPHQPTIIRAPIQSQQPMKIVTQLPSIVTSNDGIPINNTNINVVRTPQPRVRGSSLVQNKTSVVTNNNARVPQSGVGRPPGPRAASLAKSVPSKVNNITIQNIQNRLQSPKKQLQNVVTPVQTSQNLSASSHPQIVNSIPSASPMPPSTPKSSSVTSNRTLSTPSSISNKSAASNRSLLNSSTSITPSASKSTTIKESKKAEKHEKEKVYTSSSSASFAGDDDINDVAAMGGVNLAEESQRILGSTEMIGTQIRSCKDEIFLHSQPLLSKITSIASQYSLEEPNSEIVSIISHACQERLKTLAEKLSIQADHRYDQTYKNDSHYELLRDVRGQLKFIEQLDKIELKKHEEMEREMLLRAAKSRSKSEDPEQVKLKAKAKEMQRAEMEELRQKAADLTALQAIGPRKKPKIEPSEGGSSLNANGLSSNNSMNSSLFRPQIPLKPRVKRITMKDCIFLLEREKEYCKSELLYRAYLK